jgi:hypothetical protein
MKHVHAQPFTYCIGWKSLNKFYYGVRYANGCSPLDLWQKYFTSSKIVKTYRALYGEPDHVEIRKTFTDKLSAKLWEDKVLRRLKVETNDTWINVSSTHFNKSIMTDDMKLHIGFTQKGRVSPMKGKKHTEENKLKISIANSGKNNPMFGVKSPQKDIPWSEIQRSRYLATMASKTDAENAERFKKISESKKGKKHSEETKQKIKEAWANWRERKQSQASKVI